MPSLIFSACLTGEKEYLSRFGFQIGIFRPAKKVDRYFSKKKKKGERQFLQNPPPLPPPLPSQPQHTFIIHILDSFYENSDVVMNDFLCKESFSLSTSFLLHDNLLCCWLTNIYVNNFLYKESSIHMNLNLGNE